MNESESSAVKLKPVKVVFKRTDEIPTFHADGGWGLTGSDKNIVVKFYLEHTPAPNLALFPLTQDGRVSLNPTVQGDADDSTYYTIIREFQAGIVLSLAGAKQIHNMLDIFIKNHDK